MSNIKPELKEIIFSLINFTNIYILVLDENTTIKFANDSLAIDLGLKNHNDLVGKNWLDFIEEKNEYMKVVYEKIAYGKDWEKYKEFKTKIKNEKEDIIVTWFNSHINTDYNWVFSFGIKQQKQEMKNEVSIDFLRNYYHEIINSDREMIENYRKVARN